MIALVVACGLLAMAAILYFQTQDTSAPPLTPQVVDGLLRTARRALLRRDAEGILAITTDDARLLGLSRDEMARSLRRAMAGLRGSNATASWTGLAVGRDADGAWARFRLEVAEAVGGVQTTYHAGEITLSLVRVRKPRLFGLGTDEFWRVRRADSLSDIPYL